MVCGDVVTGCVVATVVDLLVVVVVVVVLIVVGLGGTAVVVSGCFVVVGAETVVFVDVIG